MNKGKTYQANLIISSILMILTLAWLTVSTPFVYHQYLAEKSQHVSVPGDESDFDPFATASEEKSEGGSGSLSEYLHELYGNEHYFIEIFSNRKCHPSDLYYAYNPELISPPPEARLS